MSPLGEPAFLLTPSAVCGLSTLALLKGLPVSKLGFLLVEKLLVDPWCADCFGALGSVGNGLSQARASGDLAGFAPELYCRAPTVC